MENQQERELLLEDWNATKMEYPSELLHEVIESQVESYSDRTAVVGSVEALTYRELNARSNRIAHALRATGVGRGQRIGLCVERNVDFYSIVLGILKAGAAYVPLDPESPAERLRFMGEDAELTLLVSTTALADSFNLPREHQLLLDADASKLLSESTEVLATDAELDARPEDPAYIIYTSGSTGKPKGVVVPHRAVVNLLNSMAREPGLTIDDVLVAVTTYSFDLSVPDLYLPLMQGATVVIASREEMMDGVALRKLLEQHQATIMQATPITWRLLLEAGWTGANLGSKHFKALVGGEALPKDLADQLLGQNIELWNMYGPTETTVWSTCAHITDTTQGISIGKPIANTTVYILDEHKRLCPIGVPGELYIGGDGVTLGYWNQPALTAERFIENPFSSTAGATLYRTGDRACWNNDGTLEHQGRLDFQVKVRGFRIELGEIENEIVDFDGVREAVVVVREDIPGDQKLVVYIVTGSNEFSDTALKQRLTERLPPYMVPSAYVLLDALPLTENGKIDRKSLPMPDRSHALETYLEPRNETEQILVDIWSDILGLESVGINDNFFEIGGHSLLAIKIVAKMRLAGMPIYARDIFLNPTVAKLATVTSNDFQTVEVPPNLIPDDCNNITSEMLPLVDLSNDEIMSVVRVASGGAVNVQDIYPLTELQRGLLFHHQMAEGGDGYLTRTLFAFSDRDRLDAYLQAIQAVIERHDILRTCVIWEGLPEPVQVVLRKVHLTVEELDFSQNEDDVANKIKERFDYRSYRLDVRQAPLIHISLSHDPKNNRWLLQQLVHHLIDDQVTMNLVRDEIGLHLSNKISELSEPIPFREFVYLSQLNNQVESDNEFFTKQLGDVEEPTVAFGLTDTHVNGFDISEASLLIEAATSQRIRDLAGSIGVTVASVFHQAWAQVLARVSGNDDVVFGTVLSGRMQIEGRADRVLGTCINTLPIRIQTSELTVQHAIQSTHKALTELVRHEHASLAAAQQCSAVEPNIPLFGSLLNYRQGEGAGPVGEHTDIKILDFEERTNYPITLNIDDTEDFFRIVAQTQSPVDPNRICNYLQVALNGMIQSLENNPTQLIHHFDVIPALERKKILLDWNNTQRDFGSHNRLHRLIEEQVERTPDLVALEYEGETLTYKEMNQRSNKLANYLRKNGVGPDVFVGVFAERSFEMVLALHAIVKAGGAYVPLDPSYPAERLANMLEDTQAPIVLAQPHLLDRLPLHPNVISLDDSLDFVSQELVDNLEDIGAPDDLAYVIFTSGSTGRPKGVMIEHQSICNRLLWMQEQYQLTAADAVLQKTQYSFDVSVWEFFWPLMTGARLVIARPEGHRDPKYIMDVIKSSGITTLHFVPSMLQVFLAQEGIEQCNSLKLVLCSGEALPHDLQNRFYERFPNSSLHNLYGPTEAAVDVTYWACQSGDNRVTVPIGRPVANTQIYILDSNMRPVPIGVAGELHIGGVQVGRGYVGRQDLTVERFIPDPFSNRVGGRLYKTGDLAKYLDDGSIEYIGRLDFQVKIRGQRIELGEIEATISEHENVGQCVALAREDTPGDQRLVAYVVLQNHLSVGEIKEYVSKVLPSHMVPSAFVFLDELPLTFSGKTDRKRLPVPGRSNESGTSYVEPQTETEKSIAEIWIEVLQLTQVGINDDFFALGGHSLLALKVIEKMRRIGLNCDVRTLFLNPTISVLANALHGETDAPEIPPNLIPEDCSKITPDMLPLVSLNLNEIDLIVSSVPGGVENIKDIYPLTALQEGFLFHHLMDKNCDIYILSYQFAFDDRDSLDRYLKAMQTTVDRHDIFRTAVLWENLSEPVQVVYRHVPLMIKELSFDPADGDIALWLRAKFNMNTYRIDIREAPLVHCFIVYDEKNDRWLLQQVDHHLIEDQVSMKLLDEELKQLLSSEDELPPPKQFREFVAQSRLNVSEAEHKAFFSKMFCDVDEPTYPYGLVDTHGNASDVVSGRVIIESKFAERVRQVTKDCGVSNASLFHLAWAMVLARTSANEDVVFGTVLSGRMRGDDASNNVIGPCINTLPVRLSTSSRSVKEGADSMHSLLAQLMKHESASLVSAIKCSSIASSAPLFSSILNYRHSKDQSKSLVSSDAADAAVWLFEDIAGRHFLNYIERTNYPFELTVDDFGDRFRLEAQVREQLEPKRVLSYMMMAIEQLVSSLECSPDSMLNSISILPDIEKLTLLEDWNATKMESPSVLLHEVFESQVEPYSDRTAVVGSVEVLTYRELNARSNRIAHVLRATGVGRGQRIGLCVERSVDMLAAALGILKAGAAYVPLDPGFPAERLRYMAEDAELTLLVSTTDLADSFNLPRERQLLLDADASKLLSESTEVLATDAELDARPEDPAYIIYTSGSTGKPKGAVVPHRAVINFLSSMAREPGLTIDDVLVAVTTLSFDIAVLELYLPLMQGATVVIASREEMMDGVALRKLLEQHQATIMQATPITWRLLLEAGWTGANLGSKHFKALVGGEALPKDLADQLLGHNIALWNMYGPTETTVWSTCAHITDTTQGISIGKPIANTTVYILDEQKRLCPIGVPGELYIGGDGVTLGYWNQPALTAERFIENPFSSTAGATLYRTGDRACWNNDGTLEHQGRLDFQVKVRGFRIELGEIEVALAEYPNILQVAVYLWSVGPDDVRIVACCVPTKTGSLASANLRKHLRARLPEYMIPQYFLPMDNIPLTPNGKVDRHRLPTPSISESSIGRYEAPANSVESTIAEIWTALIKPIRAIGRNDKFFEMGGHSLLAMRAMQQMQNELGVSLSIRLLLQESVADIAVQCQSNNTSVGDGQEDVRSSDGRSTHDSEAFYFGPSEQQLFGIYHPPTGNDGQILTIICPPLFSEFTRTHRALRELAISVAELGHHVFRFDYRGTGDSFGELEEMKTSDWIQDIELAIREGCEISGCNTVQILGVRAGALLACKSIGSLSGVQNIVLWDPIPDGTNYLKALRHAQESSLKKNINLSRAERREATHEYDYGGGYRLSRYMVEEFRLLDSSVYSSVPKNTLQVVNTSSLSTFPVEDVVREVVKFSCYWENQSEDLIFAQPVLEKLVVCLTKS